MKTPYRGHARIGDGQADVDISNVDVWRWSGIAANVHGAVTAGREAVVTLLEQPRPGWTARARALDPVDGVWRLEGIGHFHPPKPLPLALGRRSLWVRKTPRNR